MTKIDQNKILENKIKANTLDFNLNRQSAIVSAFADGNFDKYEYLTGIDLALKPNSLEKACFEHSPLGNLLSKKLKVSDEGDEDDGDGDDGDDGEADDGDGDDGDEDDGDEDDGDEDDGDEDDGDLLNQMRNHLNNLPKPVFTPTPPRRPIKQTELSTQTDPTPAPRPIKQTELSTQTDPTLAPSPTPTVQDDYVPLDLLELVMNKIIKLSKIKDRLFFDYATANPNATMYTANLNEFFTSYDFGLLDKLVKDFNKVINDLKQDDNPNYEKI